jgi:hypothetical protein
MKTIMDSRRGLVYKRAAEKREENERLKNQSAGIERAGKCENARWRARERAQ